MCSWNSAADVLDPVRHEDLDSGCVGVEPTHHSGRIGPGIRLVKRDV